MAGIGFELKKLFKKSGLAATARAYGYAGIICAGPMILGIVLLLGIMFLCNQTGGTRFERELLICMDHILVTGFPDCDKFSFYGRDQISGRYVI